MNGAWSVAPWVALVAGLSAQAPQSPGAAQQKPTFKVQVELVTTDVIVRDARQQFVPDLVREDFDLYEDGVKQDITSLTLVHGGRVLNVLAPPPAPPLEGIILPPTRPKNDTSGRILLFFVDDLHMNIQNTPKIRDLFKRMAKTLLHEGDLFGVVSSGPSSIAMDMSYDRNRMDEAIEKITGHGLEPDEIINGPEGPSGPSEVTYRAHAAFSTVEGVLQQLEQVHNRRKALIYVSNGYDFNPFSDARLGRDPDPNKPFASRRGRDKEEAENNPLTQQRRLRQQFSYADLARELVDLTRVANRANAAIYTIDPRGLIAGGDIDENINPSEWNDYIRNSQDSLRVLAEQTGGIAVVDENDMEEALKRIDAETSDYYVLGYYSKNPDPLKRDRQIEVKVLRPALNVWSRKEYSLKPPVAPVSSPAR